MVYDGFAGGELNLIDRNPPINIAILSGDIGTLNDSLDNSYHVVVLNANCTDCALSGVTVMNGNSYNSGDTLGAGVLSFGKSTMSDVNIEYNTSAIGGSAVYNGGALAQLNIIGCVLRFNTSPSENSVENNNGAVMVLFGNT